MKNNKTFDSPFSAMSMMNASMLSGAMPKHFGAPFGEDTDPVMLALMDGMNSSPKNKNEKNVYPPRDGRSVERGLKALGSAIRDFALIKASPEYAKYLADKEMRSSKEEEEKEKESKLKFEKNQQIYDKVEKHLKSLLSSKIKEEFSGKDKEECENLLKMCNSSDLSALMILSSRHLSEEENKDLKEFLRIALIEKFNDLNFVNIVIEKSNMLYICMALKPEVDEKQILPFLMIMDNKGSDALLPFLLMKD